MNRFLIGLGSALAAFTLSGAATAQNTTITGASCFPKGTYFSKTFEKFVPELNEKKAGVTINYVGGAPAIGSPFTLVQKASKGVYGMVSCTSAYYQNVLPEADAVKLIELTNEELRKNGGMDYLGKLHEEKGLKHLGRVQSYEPFHLYLNKKIDKPDLTGLHLRVSPIYTAFFQALGATTQLSNLAQIYTYMENGTVVGYGWPVTGLLPDWHKVTKYRVDPGFYSADLQLIMDMKSWNKLGGKQQKVIGDLVLDYEKRALEFRDKAKAAAAAQEKKGIEPITFTGKDREKWLTAARDAGWAAVVERSPEHGPKLRELFTK